MAELETSFFDLMGKEQGIRKLVDAFYDEMDVNPQTKVLRDLHATDLTEARNKLYWFLVGWTGGPQLYVERFGHPRLRARHLPFKIGVSERDQWLLCFAQALKQCDFSEQVKNDLARSISRLADHMRNQPE